MAYCRARLIFISLTALSSTNGSLTASKPMSNAFRVKVSALLNRLPEFSGVPSSLYPATRKSRPRCETPEHPKQSGPMASAIPDLCLDHQGAFFIS